MNANREEPAEKKTLADALLAIDGRTPSSSAEGREVAQEALHRDRRRVRIVTSMTIGLFLSAVLGICFLVYFCYVKIAPGMARYERDISALEQQLENERPQTSKPDLLGMTARMTVGQGWAFFRIQVITLWGTVAVLAFMLVAAFCTVLLIMATRRATLRQIQVSLLALSEQFDALQRSFRGDDSAGAAAAGRGSG